jgi:hypothetical protein
VLLQHSVTSSADDDRVQIRHPECYTVTAPKGPSGPSHALVVNANSQGPSLTYSGFGEAWNQHFKLTDAF